MKKIKVNIGGNPAAIAPDVWRLWLLPEPDESSPLHVRIDPSAKLKWDELDKLGRLRQLTYFGSDLGLLEYVRRRSEITDLTWIGHKQERVDLTGTCLESFATPSGSRPLLLRLPASMNRLSLMEPGTMERVVVEHAGAGAGIQLNVSFEKQGLPGQVRGLERIDALWLLNVNKTSIASLLAYESLRHLRIVGAPGEIVDLDQLVHFRKLETVEIHECYNIDVGNLPEIASLESLVRIEFAGVRKVDVDAIKERLGRGSASLSLRGIRGEEWTRANLKNPFRRWDMHYEISVVAKAIAAFRKASKAVDKMREEDDVREVLEEFVCAFNRINDKYGLDTSAVEEIADAYVEIATRRGEVSEKTALRWLDEWRTF